MDRMLREAQNKKRTDERAKPSFILLESIRCHMDMACRPLACSSFAPPSGAWPDFEELLIVTKLPSTASWLV